MRKSLLVAAALLIATPAVSQAKSLEELLVEKGVISKAEARGSMGSSGAKVWWNEGTRLEFADTGLTASFATHIESRYTYFDLDQRRVDSEGNRDRSSFDVTKARVILSGSAMHNEFQYHLNADFVGGGDNDVNTGDTNLLDGWIQWNACDWGSVRLGQYKTFVSRQFNTEDHKLQFPDRTFATNLFNGGRQAGFSGMLNLNDGEFQVNGGVFNGRSDGEGLNQPGVDNNVAGALALRYNMGGIDPYSEADVNHSDELGFTVGAAYYFDEGRNLGIERDISIVNADTMLKISGFSLAAEYYYSMVEPTGFEDAEPWGAYAQAGYFLIPKKFEIAARWGYIDGDDGALPVNYLDESIAADHVDEFGVALNYYFWAHNLKATVGYTNVRISPEDRDASKPKFNKWMFQLAGYF